MPCHPSCSSSYAPQIQSIPDRWGCERIRRALVKRGFCLAPRRVWVRGRQRNLLRHPLVMSSAKGEESYHRIDIRAQKSYFINQTRLKVLSYARSTETVALHTAGSNAVFTVQPRFAFTHPERIWCQSCSEKKNNNKTFKKHLKYNLIDTLKVKCVQLILTQSTIVLTNS